MLNISQLPCSRQSNRQHFFEHPDIRQTSVNMYAESESIGSEQFRDQKKNCSSAINPQKEEYVRNWIEEVSQSNGDSVHAPDERILRSRIVRLPTSGDRSKGAWGKLTPQADCRHVDCLSRYASDCEPLSTPVACEHDQHWSTLSSPVGSANISSVLSRATVNVAQE